MSRQRLSISVDAELARAAAAAVAQGEAPTLSAWVNDALRLKLDHERRLRALASFIAAYEERHGVISTDEIARTTRRAQDRALPVRRPTGEAPARRPRGGKKAARWA